ATLGATMAYDLLLAAKDSFGVIPVSYDDDVHPYSDLIAGRVDAVLLDHIIAKRRLSPRFVIQPEAVATGYYVGVLARADSTLRDSVDAVLIAAMRDGALEQIYQRWGVWDDEQGALFRRVACVRGARECLPAYRAPRTAHVVSPVPRPSCSDHAAPLLPFYGHRRGRGALA